MECFDEHALFERAVDLLSPDSVAGRSIHAPEKDDRHQQSVEESSKAAVASLADVELGFFDYRTEPMNEEEVEFWKSMPWVSIW